MYFEMNYEEMLYIRASLRRDVEYFKKEAEKAMTENLENLRETLFDYQMEYERLIERLDEEYKKYCEAQGD